MFMRTYLGVYAGVCVIYEFKATLSAYVQVNDVGVNTSFNISCFIKGFDFVIICLCFVCRL